MRLLPFGSRDRALLVGVGYDQACGIAPAGYPLLITATLYPSFSSLIAILAVLAILAFDP